MTVIAWAIAILVPVMLVGGIIADTRAQTAHDRYMAGLRAAAEEGKNHHE